MIGWKKVLCPPGTGSIYGSKDCYLVKLEIPDYARVVYLGKTMRAQDVPPPAKDHRDMKMRASVAYVLRIERVKRGGRRVPQRERVGFSDYDHDFIYREGGMVYPRKDFEESSCPCAPGIHFFRTRKEAEEYGG